MHDLKHKSGAIKKSFEGEIEAIEEKRSELEAERSKLYHKINKLAKERDTALKTAKLFYFGERVCGDALHDDLITFDRATKAHIREILEE